MIAKKVDGLVKTSILWTVWDCGITKLAVWEIALLYVKSSATIQIAWHSQAHHSEWLSPNGAPRFVSLR